MLGCQHPQHPWEDAIGSQQDSWQCRAHSRQGPGRVQQIPQMQAESAFCQPFATHVDRLPDPDNKAVLDLDQQSCCIEVRMKFRAGVCTSPCQKRQLIGTT